LSSSLPECWDRDGLPLPFSLWAHLRRDPQHFKNYVVVCREPVGECWVSTVWCGGRYSAEEPPLIFETMIFGSGAYGEPDYKTSLSWPWRWGTVAEAIIGHRNVVEYLRGEREELPAFTI
jgi:hypothetical protein